jgi:hypothetical protein
VNGVRIVGFDNERGEGDHCHIGGHERAYKFVSVEQLAYSARSRTPFRCDGGQHSTVIADTVPR